MKIIYKNGTDEIVEKKSRFIANVFKVESEELAVYINNNMKKKFWLTLYNIGVSILFLLSLYSYAKGMAGFSLFLALAVFGEIAARAFIECKYLQESPEIKEDTAYRITKVLRLLCEIILIIGVWRIRFK